VELAVAFPPACPALHRTMAKVCKSDGQGTFAGTQGNGELARIVLKNCRSLKLFVVASNMIGSSFGSANAGSINPQTGEAYGPVWLRVRSWRYLPRFVIQSIHERVKPSARGLQAAPFPFFATPILLSGRLSETSWPSNLPEPRTEMTE
jgi:hypothetical protein